MIFLGEKRRRKEGWKEEGEKEGDIGSCDHCIFSWATRWRSLRKETLYLKDFILICILVLLLQYEYD